MVKMLEYLFIIVELSCETSHTVRLTAPTRSVQCIMDLKLMIMMPRYQIITTTRHEGRFGICKAWIGTAVTQQIIIIYTPYKYNLTRLY